MHKHLSLLLAIFCGIATQNPVRGQGSFEFKVGAEYEIPRGRLSDLGVAGNNEDGYIQLFGRGNKFQFQHVDTSMRPDVLKGIEVKDLPDDVAGEQILHIKGKYYWFFSSWNARDKKESLHCMQLDVKNSTFADTPRHLFTTDRLLGKEEGAGITYHITNKWNISQSADSSKLLVVYSKNTSRGKGLKKGFVVGFIVFDQNFNVLWTKEVQFSTKDQFVVPGNYHVSNSGKAYATVNYWNYEDVFSKKMEESLNVMVCSAQDSNYKMMKVVLEQKFPGVSLLRTDRTGRVCLVGLYSNQYQQYSHDIDGLYMIPIRDADEVLAERSGRIFNTSKAALGEKLNTATVNLKIPKTDRHNVKIEDCVFNNDGTADVYVEQQYEEWKGSGNLSRTVQHYASILVFHVEENIKWVREISKDQEQISTDQSASFLKVQVDQNYYFLFMDNEKNTMPVSKEPLIYKDGKGLLAAVKLDATGTLKKSNFYDERKEGKYVIIKKAVQVADGQYLAVAKDDRKVKLILLKFK